MKTINPIVSLIAATFTAAMFLLPSQTIAQQSDVSALEVKVNSLKEQINDLSYTHEKILKGIDDLSWYQKLEADTYIDKVRITGPATPSKNSTAKGAKNPLIFYAYVFIPKTINPSKKYPLIVLPHGGVHGNFGSSNSHIVKELILQGYVVVAPEYRGSTGYGKGFERSIDYGGLEINDTKCSRDYMVENYDFIDKNRVGIIGWSHGGMHTLLNLFNYPDSYAVGYAGVPVSDLIMRLGYMNAAYRKLFSADYHIGKEVSENVEEYKKRSPAWNTHKLKTPLLIHGNTIDDDVLVVEVEHLIKSLKADNKKFEYEIYKDFPGGHHFDRIDSYGAKEVRLKVYQFLQNYLKPEKPFKNVKSLIEASYFPKP